MSSRNVPTAMYILNSSTASNWSMSCMSCCWLGGGKEHNTRSPAIPIQHVKGGSNKFSLFSVFGFVSTLKVSHPPLFSTAISPRVLTTLGTLPKQTAIVYRFKRSARCGIASALVCGNATGVLICHTSVRIIIGHPLRHISVERSAGDCPPTPGLQF